MQQIASWIWHPDETRFAALRYRFPRASTASQLIAKCAVFDHYELYVDGHLCMDGSLPGDSENWVPVECAHIDIPAIGKTEVEVLVIAYHSGLEHIHYRGQSRPGFWAELCYDGQIACTGPDWQAAKLAEWSTHVPRMNHLLDPLEAVDLREANWRWVGSHSVDFSKLTTWHPARGLELDIDMDRLGWECSGYGPDRQVHTPKRYYQTRAPELADEPHELGCLAHALCHQPIIHSDAWQNFPESKELAMGPESGNCIVVDFEDEIVGFPLIEVETSSPVTLNIGWSERLNDRGIPITHSKGTAYVSQFLTPRGKNTLRTFHWTGFRYLILFTRPGSVAVTLKVEGVRRVISPRHKAEPIDALTPQDSIRRLCRHTLEQTLPGFPTDCPTREKAHYWTDGLLMSLSWEKCYNDSRLMDWYIEAFKRVPLRENGLYSSAYPGNHSVMIDMCLIPIIGMSELWDLRGSCPVDLTFFVKARKVTAWFESHRKANGLVEADTWAPDAKPLVFLDHPGLPWHKFPHRGLDRKNPSAALNLYYLYALQSLTRMAAQLQPDAVEPLRAQTQELKNTIRETFWDGEVLRDSPPQKSSHAGISWLANSLGVLTGVLSGQDAGNAMRYMIDNYETVCRCTPGTIHWFLKAMRRTGLNDEARAILARLFQRMLNADATTTWETFEGSIEDSLCHPWLAAPVALFLEKQFSENPLEPVPHT